jgi:hypothetical protein
MCNSGLVMSDVVNEARQYTDVPASYFHIFADTFVKAHRMAPYGLSIEIGTRIGGSALLFLRLLERLYDPNVRPMLFTVDPYGNKPYNGGAGIYPDLYGGNEYTKMKKLIAGFPNHAHFYTTGTSFITYASCPSFEYFLHGALHRTLDSVSFVLLDGEHSAAAIDHDMSLILRGRLLRAGGIVLIDNVDVDPSTPNLLRSRYGVETEGKPYAVYEHKK